MTGPRHTLQMTSFWSVSDVLCPKPEVHFFKVPPHFSWADVCFVPERCSEYCFVSRFSMLYASSLSLALSKLSFPHGQYKLCCWVREITYNGHGFVQKGLLKKHQCGFFSVETVIVDQILFLICFSNMILIGCYSNSIVKSLCVFKKKS